MLRKSMQSAEYTIPSKIDILALLEDSDDAIIVKNLDNIILTWNRGAERIYGYTAEEVVGRSVTMLAPAELQHEPAAILETLVREERVDHLETVRLTKQGDRVDILLNVWPARDPAGKIIGALTIARDISVKRQAEHQLKLLLKNSTNRTLIMETANQVALDILASRTGTEALRHIVEAARTLAQARYAALGVARPDGQGLQEFITAGLKPEEEAVIDSRPKGIGILGLLLNRSEPLRLDVLAEHPMAAGFPAHHPTMESFLGVPIRQGHTVLGSLYLTNKEGGGAFTEADEAAVLALGAHAAVAIHYLHLLARQRALLSGLIAAQEEERRVVAYDLHDGLTQYVMASHAHLEAFRRAHQSGKAERAQRELDQGLRYLKEAVVESRRLVNGLRSLALDDLGLAGALEQLVTEEKSHAGWEEAAFLHNIAGLRYHKNLEISVYRVAQEALTNARKHAHTSHVRVTLLAEKAHDTGAVQLVLEIRDWGRGFVPEQRAEDYSHVGLQSMCERVRLIGGAYAIKSAPGEGTTIRAIFPALETTAMERMEAE